MTRCLTLADALRDLDERAQIIFHLDPEGRTWSDTVHKHGHLVAEPDLPGGSGPALLDHPSDELLARQGWHGDGRSFLAVLDDRQAPSPNIDLLIHPHPGCDADAISGVRALAGLRYAMIAPSWGSVVAPPPEQPVTSLLVSFGLIDSVNATGAILQTLRTGFSDITRIDVAMGQTAAHLGAVAGWMESDRRCRFHVGEQLEALLPQAGVVVGAAGVSMQERLAVGAVNIGVAQNAVQEPLLQAYVELGAVAYGGISPAFDPAVFSNVLQEVCGNAELRCRMASRGREIVDGKGALRTAKVMLKMAEEKGVRRG